MQLPTLPSIDHDDLEHVTGGIDLGSILSAGQQIASAVGGDGGNKAASFIGKVAPLIQQFTGASGGG